MRYTPLSSLEMTSMANNRLRAGRVLLAGRRPADVVAAAGVARQTLYTQKRPLDEDDIDALPTVPDVSRPATLDTGHSWVVS